VPPRWPGCDPGWSLSRSPAYRRRRGPSARRPSCPVRPVCGQPPRQTTPSPIERRPDHPSRRSAAGMPRTAAPPADPLAPWAEWRISVWVLPDNSRPSELRGLVIDIARFRISHRSPRIMATNTMQPALRTPVPRPPTAISVQSALAPTRLRRRVPVPSELQT